MVYDIILLAVLLAFSGFFSGSETALFSISEIQMRRLLKEKRRGAQTLQKIKSDPDILLSTILIGNNIVNIAAASIATVIAIDIFGSIGTGIAIGILTIFILIFGEIFPKSIAYSKAERFALVVARPIRILMIILWPISKLFSLVNKKIAGSNRRGVTEEDLKIALTMGEESGSIMRDEKVMIHNIFEFSDTHVSQIMTPKDDIVRIDSETSIEKALDIMIENGLSRLPVYEKEKDNIIGLVSVRDLLKESREKGSKISVKNEVKPILFVPETQKLDSLIKDLRKKQYNMAVVVDETGSVEGIVTIEDLVEEIVGDIYDETDEDTSDIRKFGSDFIVQGKTKLIDLRKKTGVKLTDKDINTVAGFIMDKIERLPSKGENIDSGKYILSIISATDKEILKVKIHKK